ncbi:MAG: ferrous iron transporter B [Peptococcaceae bacterium]|nr:ferrous iron transporter B [Peptococcaceae bacterium]
MKQDTALPDRVLDPAGDGIIRDRVVRTIYSHAEYIAARTVKPADTRRVDWDGKIDDILTSRWLGFPVMMALLGAVIWLTVAGANVPSELIASALFRVQDWLAGLFVRAGLPSWAEGFFVHGVYRTLAWVVSVMLPPMAIFFPLFTLLEDLGYLPRVAFNLDNFFKRAGAHGKQSLTMSMGFGCNAAGVIACRIIESPRERIIAILTNVFVPCNGRFPTLITLSSVFMGGMAATAYGVAAAAAAVAGMVLAGLWVTLVTSRVLSKTLLRGMPSSFTLELPPYRKPQVGRILVRSIMDRTVFVLGRAVTVAAPAGGIVWLLANIRVGEMSVIGLLAGTLEPFGRALGLDGHILTAFILGLPANEIVLPILIMSYLSTGSMASLDSLEALRVLLVEDHGWTWITALCTMLFSLLHFPCATTLLTIRQETKSLKWTLTAALIPLAAACLVCFTVAQAARALGLC